MINKITLQSLFRYMSLIDQIKANIILQKEPSFFKLSDTDIELNNLLLSSFCVKDFNDFNSTINQKNPLLFFISINDYHTNHADISNLLNFFSNFTINQHQKDMLSSFEDIVNFQLVLLNLLNLRYSFSFKPEKSKIFVNKINDLNNTPFIKNKKIIKSILSKIFLKRETNDVVYFSDNELNETKKLFQKCLHSIEHDFSVYLNFSSKFFNMDFKEMNHNINNFIEKYVLFFKSNFDFSNIHKINNLLEKYETEKPLFQNLYFNTLFLTINKHNDQNYKFFLNDYFLSDFSNKSLKIDFLQNFFIDKYYLYIDNSKKLEYLYNNFSNLDIENHKYIISNLFEHVPASLGIFSIQKIFEQLEREEDLKSKIKLKDNKLILKKI